MFRDLHRLFFNCSNSSFGLLVRLLVPAATFAYALILRSSQLELEVVKRLVLIVFTLSLLAIDGKLITYFRGLRFILLVLVIGFAIYVVSPFIGIGPPSFKLVLFGTLRLASMLIPLTTLVFWLSPNEVGWMLRRLGLKRLEMIARVVASRIPILLLEASEAYASAMLKLGRKKAYKAVSSLLVHSFLSASSFYEAYYIHGLPDVEAILFKGNTDSLVIVCLVLFLVLISTL